MPYTQKEKKHRKLMSHPRGSNTVNLNHASCAPRSQRGIQMIWGDLASLVRYPSRFLRSLVGGAREHGSTMTRWEAGSSGKRRKEAERWREDENSRKLRRFYHTPLIYEEL